MQCPLRSRHFRAAFTLIELLVVISILGVLMGLLLTAIQSSREASRRLECTNKLKQIGLALASHHSVHNHFPAGILANSKGKGGGLSAYRPFSVHFQLLPYLDQSPLYDAVNNSTHDDDSDIPRVNDLVVNRTARGTELAAFLCPSDSHRLHPGNNYRAAMGPFPSEFDSSAPPGGGGGSFPAFYPTSSQDFTDGLSQTVGFSERLQGHGSTSNYRRGRDFWYAGVLDFLRPSNSDEALEACAALKSSQPEWWHAAGRDWISGRYTDTLYNHVAPPNWDGMDCSLSLPFGLPGDVASGTITARSAHPGGVNALMMDGSVRFVKQGIDRHLWRSLGSRSGGEVISSKSF